VGEEEEMKQKKKAKLKNTLHHSKLSKAKLVPS
jgi:hypothetical protein